MTESNTETPKLRGSLRALRLDDKKLAEGVWVELPAPLDGNRIKVRLGSENKDYQAHLHARKSEYVKKHKKENFPPEVLARWVAQGVARYVVVDWDILDENNAPIAFTPEKCYELLNDPTLPEFAEMVYAAAFGAGNEELFRAYPEDLIAKN